MKKYLIIIFVLIFSFLLSSCEEVENTKIKNEKVVEIKSNIKNIANYKLEKKEFLKPYKASFDIRLENKITEKEIEEIAKKIKKNNIGYDKYFIMYYLPDMKIDNGAWATSNFNPDLKVEILGLSEIEEKQAIKNLPNGEIIGKWIDNGILGNTKIIYIENKKIKLREIYKDGSFGDTKLTQNGYIYNFDSDFGEYYKIEGNGNLGLYGESGKFDDIPKLK